MCVLFWWPPLRTHLCQAPIHRCVRNCYLDFSPGLDSNIRIGWPRQGWPCLGRCRHFGRWECPIEPKVSCRSFFFFFFCCRSSVWWATTGTISQAFDPCSLCALLKSAKPFCSGLLLFSQLSGPSILSRWEPSLSPLVLTAVLCASHAKQKQGALSGKQGF